MAPVAVKGAASALMVGWAEGTTGMRVVDGPTSGTRGEDSFLRWWRRDDDGATAKPELDAGRTGGTMAIAGAERGVRGGWTGGALEGRASPATPHPLPPTMPPLLDWRGRKPLSLHIRSKARCSSDASRGATVALPTPPADRQPFRLPHTEGQQRQNLKKGIFIQHGEP